MSFISLTAQSRACYRNFGADETFFRTLQKFRIISEYRSLDIYLTDLKFNSLNPRKEFTAREILEAEIPGLVPAPDFTGIKEFGEQFARGSRLFGAFKDRILIGINWANTRFADLTHIGRPAILLPGKTVYSYSAFVSPSWRRRGIGTRMKQTLCSIFLREGFETCFLAVYLKNNDASLWQQANGFQKWGRIFYFRSLGKNFRWSRLTPFGNGFPSLLTGKPHA